MKKTLLATLLLTATVMPAVHAADGTIEFKGEITAAACVVDPVDATQTVLLGKISSKAFSSSGETAGVAPIKITLNSCDNSITDVSVSFDGTADTLNNSLLAVKPSGASGLGIALYEADGSTQIPINSSSATKPIASGSTVTLNYIAKYMSTASSVSAGAADATAQFTVNYK